MKVKETSFIQFNLTTEKRNKHGRIKFDKYDISFIIKNKSNNNEVDDENVIKLIKEGEYEIEWHYENEAPEDEILFWIPYGGDIEIKFLGTTEKKKGFKEKYIHNGIIIYKQTYKYSEKLGEFNYRKKNMIKFLENYLNMNINLDDEEEG